MLEIIVGTMMLCYSGALQCFMVNEPELVIISVCQKTLGEHQGMTHYFDDGDTKLIIQRVNCEDT